MGGLKIVDPEEEPHASACLSSDRTGLLGAYGSCQDQQGAAAWGAYDHPALAAALVFVRKEVKAQTIHKEGEGFVIIGDEESDRVQAHVSRGSLARREG